MSFRCCAVIPSHNHSAIIGAIVKRLVVHGLPVFIIDDSSVEPHRQVLAALHAPDEGVVVNRLPENRGKGAAVMKGVELATAAGFTHLLQIDADGQHDLAEVPALLELGKSHPDALVAGAPIYDATMPRSRRIGRRITHFWAGVETLSLHPPDIMCGFRLYPLSRLNPLLASRRFGERMDFDPEVMVRMVWAGVPLVLVPVRVAYPDGNTSNFDLIGDNWRISKMHARLVLAMPLRLREIRRHRYRPAEPAVHWASLGERGAYLGLRILAVFYRFTGRYGCMAALLPITMYFYLSNAEQRRSSREFLRRAYRAQGLDREPGWIDTFRHCFAFACKTVDVFGAWMGGIDPAAIEVADRESLESVRASGQGLILIVSHLGNIEISRAVLDEAQRSRIKLLVHTQHAENFARILQRFRPEAMLNTIQVAEVNPGTVMALKDAIDEGSWVAIAGDRAPASDRVSPVPFLGSDAPFPQGPYLLAHLLECPVYLMFCLHHRGGYQLYFEKFADRIELPRQSRNSAIAHWAGRYAHRLESFCLIDPLQWYNFFDFWQVPSPAARRNAA